MNRINLYPLNIIVAVDYSGGYAKDGKIPWKLSEDMRHFKEITSGHICIMGRHTYEDLLQIRKKFVENGEPILPDRDSFVISRNYKSMEILGATGFESIRTCINSLHQNDPRKVFIIGGQRMFIEALPWVNEVFITVIKGDYRCDSFFPLSSLNQFKIVEGRQTKHAIYIKYTRK